MLKFGSSAAKAPEFVPDPETRTWLIDSLNAVIAHLGAPARQKLWIGESLKGAAAPRDLDGLFDLICAAQQQIGQGEIEFTLAEPQAGKTAVPPGFAPLGNPTGHLLHTFVREAELAIVVTPQIFRAAPLLFGSVARELGRIGLWVQGAAPPAVAELDSEVAAELSAIALGLGVWVANGAYMFENACCGGGCGIDLRSVRAGLSLPEASFAAALDARRKGLSRRAAGKLLESTQSTAFAKCFDATEKQVAALPPAREAPALRA
jgi:hypothetical protein